MSDTRKCDEQGREPEAGAARPQHESRAAPASGPHARAAWWGVLVGAGVARARTSSSGRPARAGRSGGGERSAKQRRSASLEGATNVLDQLGGIRRFSHPFEPELTGRDAIAEEPHGEPAVVAHGRPDQPLRAWQFGMEPRGDVEAVGIGAHPWREQRLVGMAERFDLRAKEWCQQQLAGADELAVAPVVESLAADMAKRVAQIDPVRDRLVDRRVEGRRRIERGHAASGGVEQR